MDETKPANRGGLAWLAWVSGAALVFCLAGTLVLVAAGVWLPRSGARHYVVNACLTLPSPSAPQLGFGWRMPRLATSVGWQPFGQIRTHRNAMCGAMPWAAYLPREGVLLLPLGGLRAGPPVQTTNPSD